MYVLGTMVPELRHEDIRAMRRRLRDETLREQEITQVSASVKELNIHPDPDVYRLQTRATTRLGKTHTQAITVCTPQSDEGDNNNSNSIQITLSSQTLIQDSTTSQRQSPLPHHCRHHYHLQMHSLVGGVFWACGTSTQRPYRVMSGANKPDPFMRSPDQFFQIRQCPWSP